VSISSIRVDQFDPCRSRFRQLLLSLLVDQLLQVVSQELVLLVNPFLVPSLLPILRIQFYKNML
jgi:hypothetical protein